MHRDLSEHLAYLEKTIVALKREMRDGNLSAYQPAYQRIERELALANAEDALRLLRQAHELEQKVSN